MAKLGKYELLEQLGVGGMGEVWRARHEDLGRLAAVKVIRTEKLGIGDPAAREQVIKRFKREAQATAQLSSPHTISLYDYGAEGGRFYYAMELLDGLNLEAMVASFGALHAPRVLFILDQICDSLAEAHAEGLIHRDIKPANLFLSRQGLKHDFVKVLDFGLVKPMFRGAEASQLTADNVTTGTPAFLAPEAARGESIDARTDIYALGCVAYWLLSGHFVFDPSNPLKAIIDHVQSPPPPLAARAPYAIPEELEALVMQCLEKSPGKRPQSALALQQQLRQLKAFSEWSFDAGVSWWREHQDEVQQAISSEALLQTQALNTSLAKTQNAIAAPAAANANSAPGGDGARPLAIAIDSEELMREPKGRARSPQLAAARSQALLNLRDHFAYSHIDLPEFERRVEAVESAEAIAIIEKQLADLPGFQSPNLVNGAKQEHPPVKIQSGSDANQPRAENSALVPTRAAKKTLLAVLTGARRQGRWTVPRG